MMKIVNQVEDFKWIKPEPVPLELPRSQRRRPRGVWAEMVPGGPCWSLEDILRATRVMKE